MLVSRGWAKRTPIKFEKPGWGKVNTGQNLFGARRLRVSLVEQAKGNKPYMNVGVQRLSEINPNKFWRNQAEGKWTQIKICVAPEDQGKRIYINIYIYIYVGAVSLSETSPSKFWRNQAEGKWTQIKICVGPASQERLSQMSPNNIGELDRGKVHSGQILFVSSRPSETNPIRICVCICPAGSYKPALCSW